MKFLMFVCTDPEPDTAPVEETATDVADWVDTYDAAGVRILGERIRPESDTVVVRKRGGKVHVTHGPYAEAVEWIVGFDVLECASVDEAVAVAAEHEMASRGRLELRPFWPFED